MKGYSVQHSFLPMLEKYKKAEDNGSVCPSNDLILAKLDSYGNKISALKLIHDYLAKRKKRTKISHFYSSWGNILFGIHQGSILCPIIFNIFQSDFLLKVYDIDITSYVHNSTIYKENEKIDDLVASLQDASAGLSKRFYGNQIKRKYR